MIFNRSFDPEVFKDVFLNPEDMDGVDPRVWLGDKRNIMLVTDDGSVGLIHYNYPGLGTAHWFYKETTRGRKAIDLGREMLRYWFDEGFVIIRGVTQKEYRAARWAARRLGFKSQGFVDWPRRGECEIFTITKEQVRND